MTVEHPTTALLEAIVAAFNTRDVTAVMKFFAEDCVLEMPRGVHAWGNRAVGFADVRATLQGRFDGIPDVHYGDDTHFVSGDIGMSKWTLRGTVAASGEKIEVRGCDFYTFRGGKVILKDSYWKRIDSAIA